MPGAPAGCDNSADEFAEAGSRFGAEFVASIVGIGCSHLSGVVEVVGPVGDVVRLRAVHKFVVESPAAVEDEPGRLQRQRPFVGAAGVVVVVGGHVEW